MTVSETTGIVLLTLLKTGCHIKIKTMSSTKMWVICIRYFTHHKQGSLHPKGCLFEMRGEPPLALQLIYKRTATVER